VINTLTIQTQTQTQDKLTANQTGVMVAFFLPTGVATELAAAVEKALPPGATPVPTSEMHVTLAYLGQAGQGGLDARVAKRLARNLKTFAHSVPALTATIGGVGRFNNDEDGMARTHCGPV